MKKKICPNQKPAYKPAELIQGKSRTYINIYITTKSGKYIQKKPTFGLGRILNIAERKKRGEAIANKLNWWLEHRYHYEDFTERKADEMMIAEEEKNKLIKQGVASSKLDTNIIDAIKAGFAAKMGKSKRDKKGDSSYNTYKSLTKNFCAYMESKRLDKTKANDFLLSDAMLFMLESKKKRSWGNNTFNINKGLYQSLFMEMKVLGYTTQNAFDEVPKLEAEDKRRKTFSDDDAAVILKYTYNEDRILFYFILLDYICFARPVEIVKMRFSDIDVANQRIVIKGENAKKIKTRYAGIPLEFLHFFKEPFFKEYPSNFYIFGSWFKPNPKKHVNKGSIWYKHKQATEYLHEQQMISTKKGYQTYGWKSLGITHFIDKLGVVAAAEQAGHKDIKTTLKYKRKDLVNHKVKDFKNVLFNPLD